MMRRSAVLRIASLAMLALCLPPAFASDVEWVSVEVVETYPGCDLGNYAGKIRITNIADGLWLKVHVEASFGNPRGAPETCPPEDCGCAIDQTITAAPDAVTFIGCAYTCSGCENGSSSCPPSGAPFCSDVNTVSIVAEITEFSCDGSDYDNLTPAIDIPYSIQNLCGGSSTPASGDIGEDVEELLCDCDAVVDGDNVDRMLEVTTYPGVPGPCNQADGDMDVDNTSESIAFKIDYGATWDNSSPGPSSCSTGGGTCSTANCALSDCTTPDPPWCHDCTCCIDKDNVTIAPADVPKAGVCALPHCGTGDYCIGGRGCDNGSCSAPTSNSGNACSFDSDCDSDDDTGDGECSANCPDCGYHCTDVEPGSLHVTVLEYKCDGGSWVDNTDTSWTGSPTKVSHPRSDASITCPAPSCD